MTRSGIANLSGGIAPGKKRLLMILAGLGVLAIAVVVRYYWGADSASADSVGKKSSASGTSTQSNASAGARQPPEKPSPQDVVATVNTRRITLDVLRREALFHYGKDVLESLVNKVLIAQECRRRNIEISAADVDAEIKRMASRFSLPVQQWLKMLKQERGIDPARYANDIIWPSLALRSLAGKRLEVTHKELVEAFETQYGPRIRARLIACKDPAKARQAHAAVTADPENFPDLAMKYSEDASASLKGLIQPIRMHGSYAQIEQAAFNMADGAISPVITAGGRYVILKRESEIPGAKAINFEQVAPRLEELIRDGKLRKVSKEVFRRLQEQAQVKIVLDDPVLRGRMPGVAAAINGQSISLDELADECIARHQSDLIEGVINRTLLEQACHKQGIAITEADLDQEIVRAAAMSVECKPDGTPDVDAWLKMVTADEKMTVQVYRRSVVWPSVALKKLVGDRVTVTDEDYRKAWEANFGPRVRVLAIVMNNLRRAQQVWEMAKNNPKPEYFGELAEQYSIEPGSRALRGEVPPIRMHGGQPKLEEEAFALSQGQLSGIVQVGQRYIILHCLGRTEPSGVSFQQVRSEIHEKIYEKKQRVEMAKYFQRLKDSATIDNYVANTTQSPKRSLGPQPSTAHRQALRRTPPRR